MWLWLIQHHRGPAVCLLLACWYPGLLGGAGAQGLLPTSTAGSGLQEASVSNADSGLAVSGEWSFSLG